MRRLVDVLEDNAWEFTIDDGGEEWSVDDYLDEWEAGAEEGDRGPVVMCVPGSGGSVRLIALDPLGYPSEVVAVLVPAL